MNEIIFKGSVRELSFETSGIYNLYWFRHEKIRFFTYKDNNELEELTIKVGSAFNNIIQNGQTIYFDKTAVFRKSMLNNLNVGLKRTIKIDKADRIVIGKYNIPTVKELDNTHSGYFITNKTEEYFFISDDHIRIMSKLGLTLDMMKTYFPGDWKKAVWVNNKITDSSLSCFMNYHDKIITSQQLVEYINTQLPSLDDNSFQTFLGMILGNEEDQLLALNMLVTFNISDRICTIADAIHTKVTTFSDKVKNSVNYKYFQLILGASPVSIVNDFRAYYWSRKLFAQMYHDGVMSDNCRHTLWKYFNMCCNGGKVITDPVKMEPYAVEQFKTYNMPINYDKN